VSALPQASIPVYCTEFTNPCIQRTKQHELLDVLISPLCAVICGANTWMELEAYSKAKEEWLKQFLTFPYVIPSHNTFARILAQLDPKELQRCFLCQIEAGSEVTYREVVAVEGRPYVASYDQVVGKGAIPMVSA